MLTTSKTLKVVGGAALVAGAFTAFSRLRYRRSAAATLAEYTVLPTKALKSRIPVTDWIARAAGRPEPHRALSFPPYRSLTM